MHLHGARYTSDTHTEIFGDFGLKLKTGQASGYNRDMKRDNVKEQISALRAAGIDTTSCFECGSMEDIQYHHIIPYSLGGRKVIPLCGNCHNMVHRGRQRRDNHSELVKEGIQRAKTAGKQIGKSSEEMSSMRRKGHQTARRCRDAWVIEAQRLDDNLRKQGLSTQKERVAKMNELGFTTIRGNQITQSALSKAISRYKSIKRRMAL
jgi:hypothetical protein